MKFGFKNPLTKEGTVAFATVLGVIFLVSGVVYYRFALRAKRLQGAPSEVEGGRHFNTRQGQKVSPVLPATTEMPTVEPTEEPASQPEASRPLDETPEEAPTATESAVTD